MPRDKALEAVVTDDLGPLPGLTSKAMFGGLTWMLRSRLFCAVSQRGFIARLDPEDLASWTARPGVTPAVLGGRPMRGWVHLSAETVANDALRQELLEAAIAFVRTLPSG